MKDKDHIVLEQAYNKMEESRHMLRSINNTPAKYIYFLGDGETFQIDPYKELPKIKLDDLILQAPSDSVKIVNVMSGEEAQDALGITVPNEDRGQWFIVPKNDRAERALLI